MSKREEYEILQKRVNSFLKPLWDKKSEKYILTHDQVQKLCGLMLEEVERVALKSHAEYVDRIGNETERIGKEKNELRAALLDAGFAIPEGKRLGEWAKYICDKPPEAISYGRLQELMKEREAHERTE